VTEPLLIAMLALPILGGLLLQAAPSLRAADAVQLAFAAPAAILASGLGVWAIVHSGAPRQGGWYLVDAGSGIFLLIIAAVGILSVLASPSHLRTSSRSFFPARRARALYYLAFDLFWVALLAIPVLDNLAVAWLVVEATTGASALLVAFSGRRSALEAGWKYLVLTTLGLTLALFGILVLYASVGEGRDDLASLDWSEIATAAAAMSPEAALLALVLILAGLAAKIGWAPVHNWLPDAHSEAPPPISALLSAALLPSVILVAWRVAVVLGPAAGISNARGLFMAFGLVSLAVAVPFLWRPQPWKRLLAYSSLEHMGVIALGIGFATPLATAGVVLHIAGHALAKSLGFYAAIPMLRQDPAAAVEPVTGLAAASPATAGAFGVSLASLSGLPPSPLFFSEVLIVLGGIAGGNLAVAAVAVVLLAVGFVGLAHALIEGLAGPARRRRRRSRAGSRTLALTGVMTAALLALSASASWLPGAAFVRQLMDGVT
jgi:hydrogenase-4 component F